MNNVLGVFSYDSNSNRQLDMNDIATEINRIHNEYGKPFFTTSASGNWQTGLLFTKEKISKEEAETIFSELTK